MAKSIEVQIREHNTKTLDKLDQLFVEIEALTESIKVATPEDKKLMAATDMLANTARHNLKTARAVYEPAE